MKLNIGGTDPHPEWKILNVEERPEVDFICDASDLSQFEDGSIEIIYASHILEHFHHSLNGELIFTLAEWYRVLKQGGKLMISVPDIKTLSWLYTRPDLDVNSRVHIMAMMYGGQTNKYDVHKVGFDFDILCLYLKEVGFSDCQRVESFDLFNDSSTIRLAGTLISLNAIATK